MKKLKTLVVILVFMLITNFVFIQVTKAVDELQKESFNDIKWGTNISTLSDMEYYKAGEGTVKGIEIYLRKKDDLQIGEAKLERIEYGFWMDKFYFVNIFIKGDKNLSRLRKVLFEKFGSGYQPDEYIPKYYWFSVELISISLEYDKLKKKGQLAMLSNEISKQVKDYEKQKNKSVNKPEAKGFRDIKWETNISAFSHMMYYRTDKSFGGIKYYLREEDQLEIGEAKLERIEYGFWENKFCGVIIYFKGEVNWINLKEIVFEKFGSGYQPDEYIPEYYWLSGDLTDISLRWNRGKEEGSLSMTSKEIVKQWNEYEKQKRKEAIEKGF